MTDFNQVFTITKNLSILFVEDDKAFREETSDILETLFSTIDIAVDGREALDKYTTFYKNNNKYYDLIISDIRMPFLDGVNLTKEIYKLNKTQPIIIVSAHNESEYLLDLINMGIEQFLTKPLNIDNFLDVIYNCTKKINTNSNSGQNTTLINISNNFTWDINKDILLYKKEIITLSHKEILLLKLFIKNKSKVSIYDEIFNTLWEDDYASAQSLKPIVSRLRKKLSENSIESISKLGYRLIF